MKVLFYIEPLIEMGRPSWKDGWLRLWSIPLAKEFISQGDEALICVSESLTFLAPELADLRHILFTHNEMTNHHRWEYLSLSRAWFDGTYSEDMIGYYKTLMRQKLGDFTPDLILTFTSVPFFKEMFPNATVLHREYSLFSRSPFPETWFLDPMGPLGGGAGRSAHLVFKNPSVLEWGGDHKKAIDRLRRVTKEVCLLNNPFFSIFEKLRQKFSRFVLLPCQFSDYYLFDSHARFQSQFEFVSYCLECIPQDIGVVVTMHPEHGILSADAISYFRKKYPHFIYSKIFECVYAGTQLLMPFVDGVVTVSSTVAFQCLIWEKKIFSIGGMYLEGLFDADSLDSIHEVLSRNYISKDPVLFWMVNSYAYPKEKAFDVTALKRIREAVRADEADSWSAERILNIYRSNAFIEDVITAIKKGRIFYRKDKSADVVIIEARDARIGSDPISVLAEIKNGVVDVVIDPDNFGIFNCIDIYIAGVPHVLSMSLEGEAGSLFVHEGLDSIQNDLWYMNTPRVSVRLLSGGVISGALRVRIEILASGLDANRFVLAGKEMLVGFYTDQLTKAQEQLKILDRYKVICSEAELDCLTSLKGKLCFMFRVMVNILLRRRNS